MKSGFERSSPEQRRKGQRPRTGVFHILQLTVRDAILALSSIFCTQNRSILWFRPRKGASELLFKAPQRHTHKHVPKNQTATPFLFLTIELKPIWLVSAASIAISVSTNCTQVHGGQGFLFGETYAPKASYLIVNLFHEKKL